MGRITTDVGLISGLPVTDTIKQLLAISARPRDLLISRTRALLDQQSAIGQLTALTLGVQFAIRKLATPEVFETAQATSSSTALTATVTGEPTAGSYRFTPVRTAQAHQVLSSGYASASAALGGGTLSIGYGGFVDESRTLAELNGGAGVERGKIRITDRSGQSATIDLSLAHSLDDVLNAINNHDDIDVRAETVGDAIRLTDNTGQTFTNLRVQEVSGGQTAADLGLAGINGAAASATGDDVLSLHNQLSLARLNDGGGITLRHGVPDLTVTFRDGSSPLDIDFNEGDSEQTLGDLLATLNAADPARFRAEIAPGGDQLQFIDLTADLGGTFSVASTAGGSLAEELQLNTAAAGDTLTSGRLLGGLKTTLLSSLNGGQGLASLGSLALTDRSGATATVDLSGAGTLDDVLAAINAAGIGISASINGNQNGIRLTDTSGGVGNLIAANGDASNTATRLGITGSEAQNKLEGTSLNLRTVSGQTKLDDFNGGRGVARGAFVITDSSGASTSIDLRVAGVDTLGDVLDLINASGIGVTAGWNATGDGILLTDTAAGSGTLKVREVGSGTAAADLHLLGEATGGQIDGSSRVTLTLAATDTLEDLVDRLNEADAGLAASVFNDGSGGAAHHLALNSQATGRAGRLNIEHSLAGLSFRELAAGRDALLLLGDVAAGGVIASSATNRFEGVVAGLALTVNAPEATPVTVEVAASLDPVVANVKLFVQQYNSLRAKLGEVASFNAESNTTGVLFGSSEVLRLETDLARVISGRFVGAGDLQSFEAVGIHVQDDGTLQLDEEKLREQFAANPQGVRNFFSTETQGAAHRLDAALEQLVGEGNSLLLNRGDTLQRRIDQNNDRITFMNERLEHQRTRLQIEFATLEQALAKFQSNVSSIATLQQLAQSRVSTSSRR